MPKMLDRLKHIYKPNLTNISVAFSALSVVYFLMKFGGIYGLYGVGFGAPLPIEADLANIDPTLAPEINPGISMAVNLVVWYIITSPILSKVRQDE